MLRVRIVHWKPEEASPLIEACKAGGFDPVHDPGSFPVVWRAIRQSAPDVAVIDLSRLPSHGREVAMAIRKNKATRHVPLVFNGGETEKVEALRQLLPDADFCSLKRLVATVKAAAKKKPVPNPVSPPALMQSYGGRTTAQKLGLKPATSAALFDAPRDYATVLGELPDGAGLMEDPEGILPVTLWFVYELSDYLDRLPKMSRLAGRTKLWIIWRKGSANGLNDKSIRESAIEAGLVDYKICSVNAQWSGMLFARKKA